MSCELLEKLQQAVADVEAQLKVDASKDNIEKLRIAFLGRNGLFPALSKEMGGVPKELKKDVGIAFNSSRKAIEEALENAKNAFAVKEEAANALDVTLNGRVWVIGHKHPKH